MQWKRHLDWRNDSGLAEEAGGLADMVEELCAEGTFPPEMMLAVAHRLMRDYKEAAEETEV